MPQDVVYLYGRQRLWLWLRCRRRDVGGTASTWLMFGGGLQRLFHSRHRGELLFAAGNGASGPGIGRRQDTSGAMSYSSATPNIHVVVQDWIRGPRLIALLTGHRLQLLHRPPGPFATKRRLLRGAAERQQRHMINRATTATLAGFVISASSI